MVRRSVTFSKSFNKSKSDISPVPATKRSRDPTAGGERNLECRPGRGSKDHTVRQQGIPRKNLMRLNIKGFFI